ncbi:putative proteasome activator subunit 3 (PA28 gamma) [Monocercomonoides exilis]|uniref:putative proteasome activator subunit 3 (PA28 gamma) n=1 Tax=Monocercomonoides exilis TaxID=2049356 RepID=UPI0035596557|nr:putative proteasome activator subunit 3 (PA28 gamma) [Monocercomonoides exilis]|eukprot:MONOS_2513.1-p1 / transcript=MONOS_2513.1 / gene=MONOS_2513 / organism=Monocercomonoides_exilis_PA203 / gene_product=unspecified product / transcript_product=unspecified product / location=Mono_scaffold00052:86830-87983(-) / protein_length=256 / sequence_SO=supercontig / SO=protein_coding / is_pseudo=false
MSHRLFRNRKPKEYTKTLQFSKDALLKAEERAKGAINLLYSKVSELTVLIDSFESKKDDVSKDCIFPTPAPYEKPRSSVMPMNKTLIEMQDILYQQCRDYFEIYAALKIWIQLRIPSVESGMSFDVSVQTELSGEIEKFEDGVFEMEKSLQGFDEERMRILEKIVHYPTIMSYRKELQQNDSSQYISSCLLLFSLRNDTAFCIDLLSKNKKRLGKPLDAEVSSKKNTPIASPSPSPDHLMTEVEINADDDGIAGMY